MDLLITVIQKRNFCYDSRWWRLLKLGGASTEVTQPYSLSHRDWKARVISRIPYMFAFKEMSLRSLKKVLGGRVSSQRAEKGFIMASFLK